MHAGVQVEVLSGPSLDDFAAKVESFKPNFLYIKGPFRSLIDSVKGTLGPIAMSGTAQQECTALVLESKLLAGALAPS